ncbi:hypothetical protein HAZT_HAZT010270 [Hyalella azteca]|uniref:Probable ribosome biogenesis protein RLP24 n=1 Tax=Hyalella azteca TaxID=294128 RepID=A0A6A0HD32_HYAAZ|nr:hypothetical protein HAZT_HAZT010270 [Hyalella azteca]
MTVAIFKFCTSKCRKNFQHKRNPRKARWTKSFRKLNGKELTSDATFEFERRRNIPIKYNREKWSTVVSNLETIASIRHKRESKVVLDRLKVDKKVKLAQAKFLVRKHIAVIKSPAAGLKLAKKVTKKDTEEEMDEVEPKKQAELRTNAETLLDDEDDVIVRQHKAKKSSKKNVQFEDDDEEEEVSAQAGEKRKILENMDVDEDSDNREDEEEESDDE